MESKIRRKETAKLPTEYGNFTAVVYECDKKLHHIALIKGIKIVKRIPLIIKPTSTNKKYLKTKKEKLGHYLDSEGFVE